MDVFSFHLLKTEDNTWMCFPLLKAEDNTLMFFPLFKSEDNTQHIDVFFPFTLA
jgi:hypothetical protein